MALQVDELQVLSQQPRLGGDPVWGQPSQDVTWDLGKAGFPLCDSPCARHFRVDGGVLTKHGVPHLVQE
jgi:hypothetical protein